MIYQNVVVCDTNVGQQVLSNNVGQQMLANICLSCVRSLTKNNF